MVVCRCKPQKIILQYYWLLFFIFLNFSQNGYADVHGTFLPKNVVVPAILAFGDSIIDPGNNDYLKKTVIKCNFPPYGRDFNGGIPTGRFSNGKIPTDIIANEFGIKKLLPAYLDPKLTIQDLLTGVSFASGGCGYDPLTSKIVSVLSLDDQLNLFKEYIKRIKAAVGEERTAAILSSSIFVVCVGSDDIANTYYSPIPLRRVKYDVPSYTDLMIESASSFLQQIYSLGGRRIAVLSIPVIGCVPSQRTAGGGIERACYGDENTAATLFNRKLSSFIDFMGEKFSDAKILYLDIYNPLLQLIQNPAQYGFEVFDRGCCGTGKSEVTLTCNSLSIGTCQDANKFIFWDSYHPTQKAYEILISKVLGNITNKFF